MKVYVAYVLADYPTAIYMGVDEEEVQREANEAHDRTGYRHWIVGYDFSEADGFELEC